MQDILTEITRLAQDLWVNHALLKGQLKARQDNWGHFIGQQVYLGGNAAHKQTFSM